MEPDKRKIITVVGILAVLLTWMLIPLIGQYFYDYSAIKLSFGITVLYYIGFQIWKRFLKKDS